MKIGSVAQFNNSSYPKKTSFEGFRAVLNYNKEHNNLGRYFPHTVKLSEQDKVDDFLSDIKILGDVTLEKREIIGGEKRLTPVKATLVGRCFENHDGNPEYLYGLYQKGLENLKTPREIDSSELGMMIIEPRNINNAKSDVINGIERDSIENVEMNYHNDALYVNYLASHEGDKYKGIGTQLLNNAIAQSFKNGLKGKTFLYSYNHIPQKCRKNSKYTQIMETTSPSGFYYNYGFRTLPSIEQTIKKTIKSGATPPDGFYMYLPRKTIAQLSAKTKELPTLD